MNYRFPGDSPSQKELDDLDKARLYLKMHDLTGVDICWDFRKMHKPFSIRVGERTVRRYGMKLDWVHDEVYSYRSTENLLVGLAKFIHKRVHAEAA